MSSTIGQVFKITTWGESHGKAIGVVVEGCPPGISLSEEDIQLELNKRKPGQSKISTPRKEKDKVEILSGIFEGVSTGTPISMIVLNEDQQSTSYDNIKELFRPGHADYTYHMKYGIRDHRGGGRSSGRETIGRVAAGAIAKKILALYNITIHAYTKSIGNINISQVRLDEIENNSVRCPDPSVAKQMEELILEVKKENDSIGGIVEVISLNVPPGLGEPVFDKLDANIAKTLMSIGAVKGVEIGDGFQLAKMRGKEANDCFINKDGKIQMKTNHSGGILGGISTGMPIVARVAVKPTPSIDLEQETVNINGENKIISIKGRHDPCIVPRIVPVIENMMAIVICDHFLINRSAKL